MLKALNKYYEECGISALKFNCKNYKECKSRCKNPSKFTKAKEPYIGAFYGKKKIPKLLFLSLDSGGEKKSRKTRTIEAVRKNTLRLSLKKMPKQRHWYKTHQFAWVIFDEIKKLFNLKIDIGKADNRLFFKSKADIDRIKPYFAHTNSAKCCVNNINSKQANRALFDNCRGYIPEELRIFDPHILVTQGQSAQKVIEEAIKERIFSLKKQQDLSMANKKKPDLRIIEINKKKPVLWIHHYHPRNYGVFNTKVYPNYRDYAKNAARFILKYHSDTICTK